MRRSILVSLAGALALSGAAGAAQARDTGGSRDGYSYDYRSGPGFQGQGRFDNNQRFSNRDGNGRGDRFANEDRGGNQNRFGGPPGGQQVQGNGAFLGISLQPLNSDLANALKLPDSNGALVADVQANSPAASAGVKAGDVVVAINGKAINNAADVVQTVRGAQPNTQIAVTVLRAGAKQDLQVTLGGNGTRTAQNQPAPSTQPAAPAPGTLGITIAPGRGQSGVVITQVGQNTPAQRAGLQRGDQIVGIGDMKVSSPGDVTSAVAAAKQSGTKYVLLRVVSGEAAKFVAVQIG